MLGNFKKNGDKKELSNKPEDWNTCVFSEIVQLNPRVKLDKNDEYSYVEMKDLNENGRYCSSSNIKRLSGGARFIDRDTLFARITPCLENGKICQVIKLKNGIGFGSTEFLVMRSKESITDNDFVYYLARSEDLRSFAESNFDGSSGRQRVNVKTFDQYYLNLPPLPEQRAIAGVLSSLDDKIDLLRRQNKTLEALAETIFKKLFIMDVDVSCPSVLSEHINIYRGLSYKGSGLCSREEGVPMHNLNSIYEGGGYKYSGIKYYKGDYKEKHLIRPGDIIVANTEQGHKHLLIGYPAIIPKTFGEYSIFSQHLYKIEKKNESCLSNVFIYYLLKSRKVWEQVASATNGSTVNMLSLDGIANAEFNLPKSDLMNSFSSLANFLVDKQEMNINMINTLTRLRDFLLPKLISGDARVKFQP